jgi:hypothetical protein
MVEFTMASQSSVEDGPETNSGGPITVIGPSQMGRAQSGGVSILRRMWRFGGSSQSRNGVREELLPMIESKMTPMRNSLAVTTTASWPANRSAVDGPKAMGFSDVSGIKF